MDRIGEWMISGAGAFTVISLVYAVVCGLLYWLITG